MLTEEAKVTDVSYFFMQVYKQAGKVAEGKIYSPMKAYEIDFQGFDNAILLMDDIMDEEDFPQKSMRQRTFAEENTEKKKMTTEGDSAGKGSLGWHDILFREERRKIYFSIHVMYRQNASWQGRVQWRKEVRIFRSTLELLHLLKEAFDKETENINSNF